MLWEKKLLTRLPFIEFYLFTCSSYIMNSRIPFCLCRSLNKFSVFYSLFRSFSLHVFLPLLFFVSHFLPDLQKKILVILTTYCSFKNNHWSWLRYQYKWKRAFYLLNIFTLNSYNDAKERLLSKSSCKNKYITPLLRGASFKFFENFVQLRLFYLYVFMTS